MKEPAFVHLALHTEYSLIDSVVRIPALMQRCAELGLPAAALTDQDNLFAMVKFYRQAMRAGVKPLIGADLTVAGDDDPATAGSLILLCKSVDGYRNLTRLISRSYLEGQQHGRPMLNRDWLSRESTTGLIGLAGGMRGSLARPLLGGDGDTARAELDAWRQVFGEDFVLDVARVGRSDEERHIDAVVNLAVAEDVAVVATNDVRFLAEDDFNAHEARVCIHQGRVLNDPKRPHDHTRQQYLRSPDEMAELFADLPEAVSNTLAIAEKLNLDIELGQSYLPEFPVPDGMTARSYLDKLARDSLAGRLDEPGAVLAAGRDDYGERLGRELGVIGDMGFPGYFLIVADFIRWAKEHGVPVGPGRGSGAGSLVAYVLGITDIDPLRYDLLFERFLNPERVSMPDFDIDFCMEGRDSVIDYVAERYGRERVSQIITYGTMAAKAVVRDAGRVLGQPYGFVDRIAKLIPFEIGMTLDKALDSEAELAELVESDGEVAAVMELARSLEGLVRNAGKHAGGVVIAPTELTDFAPLYCE
ncbi:MAG: DNA polymerase III subunit alpha, partial [Pseudomonadota bacterium]